MREYLTVFLVAAVVTYLLGVVAPLGVEITDEG